MRFLDRIGKISDELTGFDPGHVWLAGAGPGRLGAVSVEVLSAIRQADAIVYDALVNKEILDFAEEAELHFAGKRGGAVSAAQAAINDLLVALARSGKRVLRLKGGDPFVFGRGGEEAIVLSEAGIPFRVLPGISSAFAALATARIPATMRGHNRALILATGHAAGSDDDLDWAAIAATGQPVIVYMGLTHLDRIASNLIAGGMAPGTPAAVIMAAATPEERIVVATAGTIGEAAREAGLGAPSLIVFGTIVSLRQKLDPCDGNQGP